MNSRNVISPYFIFIRREVSLIKLRFYFQNKGLKTNNNNQDILSMHDNELQSAALDDTAVYAAFPPEMTGAGGDADQYMTFASKEEFDRKESSQITYSSLP